MQASRIASKIFWLCILISGRDMVVAQDFPAKPIRVVTAGVGGGNDFLTRLIAPGMSSGLGQQIIVENRGGNVTVPGELVLKSPPDGYTALLIGTNFWITPYMQKVPYDPLTDFAPVTLLARSPHIVVVHPSLPVRSVRNLIDLAKAKPEALSYSTGPTASSTHLAAELFKYMTGVRMVRIPYNNGATEITDLLGGQVQLTFGSAASVMPHVKSNRLRAIAVTSLQPSALAPGLSTVSGSGVPGFESGSAYGIFVPGKTPLPVINRLNHEIVRVAGVSDVKQKMFEAAVESVGSSSAEFAAMLKTETSRMSKVIKDAGIRAD